MIEYSDPEFEKKLMLLKDTQDAIQSLSSWCLKRHEHYKSIIAIWLKAIRKVKIEKRLTLFYLANDVIQYSKKKNYKFIDGWATAIQKAIPYVRDEKIQSKILRIIKIWEERGVYDDSYLADLTGLLTTPIQKLKLADPVQEFQIHALAVKIRSCVKLEQITDLKMKNLREANLPLTNNEAIQNMLKDRTRSHEFLNELNDGMLKIESYIKCLKRETIDRAQLIDALEVATSYYEEQNGEVKTVAQAYFNYTKRVKLLKSKLESLVGSMPTDSPMPSPDINAPSPSSSSVSIEDLTVHNINYDTVLNSDKYMINSSMENSINDSDIYVPTTVINNIKSYIAPDTYTTVQAIENQDQQSLTSQFPYDAPSPPPDETFAYSAFPNQTDISYTNDISHHDKSSTYSTSSYEAYVPTPMPSSQQFLTSEFSNNMIPPTNSSSLINENTIPVSLVPQTDWDVTVHNDWSTNDTPASPPFHEKISYQNTPNISKSDGGPGIDHCVLASKVIDRDERIPQEIITKTSDIDHRNLISLTHSPSMNSSVVSVDVDYRAFPGIPMPPSPPALLMEAVSKPQKDNVESVDMDLSDDDEKSKSNHDQKHPVLLPPPLPPPMPFDFDQQSVPDVTNQWEQPSQPWSPTFNDNQWNVEQSEPWKHSNQWEIEQSDSNFVHNQPQLQWPQHAQRPDFRPKWKRGISNWPRGPRYLPISRPPNRWTLGPRFGPRNQPW
ncbi:regulation of nuclear pre-mRNA domain-containing protein 2 isoform X3 [Rhopalosiphum maidis]|uniref:regulation of nuclear pre-mRNA domain-containing protein 2 isoform X3 n=1 Tax=Rhopalosiphum maidis TaxID=43146 RepID=UPI000EFF881B|nr:regulation of nuclear pre-mRNA domain-containing protein 2 isoform X3 [Rhopalosiphum maidis]